jgi:hypothetical protein
MTPGWGRTMEESKVPARRGNTFLPTAVCAPKKWVMDFSGKTDARRGVTSGSLVCL